MTDVTNPGQVTVEDEVYSNPDPNNSIVQDVPRNTGAVVPVANYARKPASNGVSAQTFSTPVELSPDVPLFVPPVATTSVPPATEVNIASQSLVGVNTPDFIVVGPAESFQTNTTDQDLVSLAITGVYDADNLPNVPSPTTTRFYLMVAVPPILTSYPVSLLGRQLIWLTEDNEGAARFITGYGSAYVVVNRVDLSEDNGGVPELAIPMVGNTLSLDVARRGSEQVNTVGETINVVISPPPPVAVPNPPQAIQGGNTSFVSTGAQPVPAPVEGGESAPRTCYSNPIDQPPPAFPIDVFV
jgi:hypothetical protein